MMIDDVLKALPRPDGVPQLPKPTYTGSVDDTRMRLGLCVPSMAQHTSNEGMELFRGLNANGYRLYGHGLPNESPESTDVAQILLTENPSTVLIQDPREWQVRPGDFRNPRERFSNYYRLGLYTDIFKVSILKDAHQRPEYHRRFLDEICCHAVVCYYHPRIVSHLAPYVRREHLIRTYHTIDPDTVPEFKRKEDRKGAVLSGAISGAYPLRQMIKNNLANIPLTDHLRHPGYHRRGSNTPRYLEALNQYRISICTCSVYGYALRKIIESTAAGCVVITNLPEDEVLPGIDDNLIRVGSDISPRELGEVIRQHYACYNEERQRHYSSICKAIYDYRRVTATLAHDIEYMRRNWLVGGSTDAGKVSLAGSGSSTTGDDLVVPR